MPVARKAIESILAQSMGLQVKSIGSESIDRAVRDRMAQCGLSTSDDYLEKLQTSRQELGELLEVIVVAETWFFRDMEPFVFLKKYALTQWLPAHRGKVLRVLSVPCCTGEEPYSVAMALLDAGMTPEQFTIHGVDISRRALHKARQAVYGRNSFRGEDLSYQKRHFREENGQYRLNEEVRETVHFMWGNLIQPRFLGDQPVYHVILCRNLLIYFDKPARERAARTLERLLADAGLLFLGHAETLQVPSPLFKPVRHPRAFACIKTVPALEKPVAIASPRAFTPVSHASREKAGGKAVEFTSETRSDSPFEGCHNTIELRKPDFPGLNSTTSPSMEAASELADRGLLREAAEMCEKTIRTHGPSARAYLLLGLIHESTGNVEQAEECLNKTVYLDPDHHEALIHLALLAEHRGDTAGAARFHQRAKRAQENRTKK